MDLVLLRYLLAVVALNSITEWCMADAAHDTRAMSSIRNSKDPLTDTTTTRSFQATMHE